MKFKFRGSSYYSAPLSLNTINSGLTGKFHGGIYQIRCPIIAAPPTTRKLKYRGITY